MTWARRTRSGRTPSAGWRRRSGAGRGPPRGRGDVAAGRPWAKSGVSQRLLFEGGVAFRHELASLLIIDGPLHVLLADAPDAGLARYLVLAHHGKLRVQVRDPGEASPHKLLGLEQGAPSNIPPLLGQPATRLAVSLDQFQPGGESPWTSTVLGLRDRY